MRGRGPAVLACGPDAALSHASAAALWEIRTLRFTDRRLAQTPTHVARAIRAVLADRRAA